MLTTMHVDGATDFHGSGRVGFKTGLIFLARSADFTPRRRPLAREPRERQSAGL